jgi:CIC family chloride channel protein
MRRLQRLPRGVRFSRYVIARLGSKTLYLLILATIIGVVGGLGAVLFRWMIRSVNYLAFPLGTSIDALGALPWYAIVGVPILGGVIVGPVIYFLAREAKGHGVPEVMDAVMNRGGRIRPRVAFVKILASAVSIGVGGSVGREGPIVQIGSGIGSTLGQALHLDTRSVRLLVGCGAAAGIAATFNAPIAGALFALEIIIGTGTVRQFAPLVVATVAGTVVSRGFLGNVPAFQVRSYALGSPWELITYVVLGLLAAVVAVGFSRGLYWMEDLWERLPIHDAARPAIGGAIVGGLALALPEVMGSGYEAIEHVLAGDGHYALIIVLGLLVAKMLATHVSLGSGFSGGVFAPSLFIGAMLGAGFGLAAEAVLPSWLVAPSGGYAVVGMGAVVAAATHAPLTVILIVFEMTGDYHMILQLMLATLVASTLSLRLSPASIYTLKLRRRGASTGERENFMHASSVGMVLRAIRRTVAADAPWATVIDAALRAGNAPCYVVNAAGEVEGAIYLEDVAALIRDEGVLQDLLIATDVMRNAPEPACLEDSLADCLKTLTREGIDERPVVDESNTLLGVVARRDLLALYDREVLRQGCSLVTFEDQPVGASPEFTTVQVPTDQHLATVRVDGDLIGRTLRDLDVRARMGVQVQAVQDAPDEPAHPPDPTSMLEKDSLLLVMGPRDGVSELLSLASSSA